MALPGGSAGQGAPQQTINLGELAERVVQGAYSSLKRTLDGLPSKPQPQRCWAGAQRDSGEKDSGGRWGCRGWSLGRKELCGPDCRRCSQRYKGLEKMGGGCLGAGLPLDCFVGLELEG